jgi:hypothetical protein
LKTLTQQYTDSRYASAFDPDHSGPARRPFQRPDRIVMRACLLAAAALGVILWTADAKAQDTSPITFGNAAQDANRIHLVAHGLSHHAERTRTNGAAWNERNAGLGLRYQLDATWGVQAGAYRNSVNATSVYGWVEATPLQAHVASATLSGGAFAGVVNGYKANNGGFRPAGGLLARAQISALSLTGRLIPKGSVDGSPVVSVEAGWRF